LVNWSYIISSVSDQHSLWNTEEPACRKKKRKEKKETKRKKTEKGETALSFMGERGKRKGIT
jgi:hypothetical protein